MNWKLIFVGGLVFYVVMFVIGMGTGAVIHGGILEPTTPRRSSGGRS